MDWSGSIAAPRLTHPSGEAQAVGRDGDVRGGPEVGGSRIWRLTGCIPARCATADRHHARQAIALSPTTAPGARRPSCAGMEWPGW